MNHDYAIFDTLGAHLETRQSRTVLTPTATDPVSLATLARASYPKTSGRWYFTALCWGDGTLAARIGIATADADMATALGGDANGYGLDTDGSVYTGGAGMVTGTTFGKGDIVGVLLDITTNAPSVSWYVNGQRVYTQALASVGPWYLAVSLASDVDYGVQCFLNAGQRRFAFAPTGANDGWYAPVVATQGVRLADRAYMTSADADAPNLRYHDALTSDSRTQAIRSLSFWPWGRQVNSGAMEIEALNDGPLDPMLTGSVRDMRVTVQADIDGARTPLYTAVVDAIKADADGLATITCRDPLAMLQVPLQRWMIRPDRDPDSANTPRPILLGACRNVPIKQIDATHYVFACADQPMMGIGFCRVAGYPLDPAAGDFTLDDDKIDITLSSEPDGIVTLDASSVGGQQLPDVTKDIYGGAGAPFTGDYGSAPTGWDDTGADVVGAEPVMGIDALTFPVVQASPTVYAKMPVCCIGVTGSVALRIQWLDATGDVIREKLSTEYTGTTNPTYIDAEVLDSLPANGVAARVQAVAFDHTAGTIRVGDIEAYYVRWGDRTSVTGLVNADFSAGDLTGWHTSDPGWAFALAAAVDGQQQDVDNATYTGVASNTPGNGILQNTGAATDLTEGVRINATAQVSIVKPGNTHPAAAVGIFWYDANDKVIGWQLSTWYEPRISKSHDGGFVTVSVAASAPANVSYAKLTLHAAKFEAGDATKISFRSCGWDYVAKPSSVDADNLTQIQIGTFADGTLWDLGPGWTIHAAGADGPDGAEYAEHLP